MSKISPSRDFLIRQAVLNAAAEMFPVSARAGLLPTALSELGYTRVSDVSGTILFRASLKKFRELTAIYGQVAA
jgi:hypothetical protein